jgi:hypothetical protein
MGRTLYSLRMTQVLRAPNGQLRLLVRRDLHVGIRLVGRKALLYFDPGITANRTPPHLSQPPRRARERISRVPIADSQRGSATLLEEPTRRFGAEKVLRTRLFHAQ